MNNHKIEHEVKLNLLSDRIHHEGIMCHNDMRTGRKTVDRQTLKEFISGTFHIHDPHTVNGWIDELVNLHWFDHNPDSQKTAHGHTKPSNDTRYYINFDKISHTHIDSYSQSNSRPRY